MIGLYYCDWHEVYATNLALAVAERSHNVTAIVRECAPEFQGREVDANSSRSRLREGISELYVLPGRHWSVRSVKTLRGILGPLRKVKNRYDYFHIQQTCDPRFLWVAARIPTALTLHEPGSRQGVTRKLSFRSVLGRLTDRAYRSLADVIIVHTRGSLNMLPERDLRKAVVIPHGVRTAAPGSSATPSAKTVLFFGRAARYKGIDTLVAAMGRVWEVDPEVRLEILASHADPECEVDVADPRVSASWNGYSESELDSALGRAHLVCLPYKTASGTGVGTRAYGAGRPIVASDLEGLRELVSDPKLLCRPGDVEDLGRALVLALSRDFDQQAVDSRTTWPAVADAHIARYESIADN